MRCGGPVSKDLKRSMSSYARIMQRMYTIDTNTFFRALPLSRALWVSEAVLGSKV